MKKIVFIGLVAILIFNGCQQESQKLSKNELFEKKNLCASYKSKITAELTDRSKDAFIGEIFFSPSLNTCLYTGFFLWEENGDFYYAKTIEDYLENKQIFHCVSESADDKCDIEHENKVKELKNA